MDIPLLRVQMESPIGSLATEGLGKEWNVRNYVHDICLKL